MPRYLLKSDPELALLSLDNDAWEAPEGPTPREVAAQVGSGWLSTAFADRDPEVDQ